MGSYEIRETKEILENAKHQPGPHALTREQVEEYTSRFHNCGFLYLKKAFDDHDAALRATIEQQAQELEQAKGNYAIQKAAADDYEQQLAASQARGREMERDKEQAVFALGQLEEKYLQLQATLAARCRELEEQVHHSREDF